VANVSFFQRYSQKENHVTNNTLLVMRHLYQNSPDKLEQVLRELLGDDKIEIGPNFTQQQRVANNVPDAMIAQAPFSLYFETKLSQALDLGQLKRHVESIASQRERNEVETILIGLSTARMLTKDEDSIATFAKERGVLFRSVSFSDIRDAVLGACADYEASLRAVVEDYIDFLSAQGLLYASEDWMLTVPCGVSYAENQRFGIYYDGADRPSRSPCRFLGIYKDKRVSLVGLIKAVLICTYEAGEVFVQAVERGSSDPEALDRIRQIVEATSYYDLKGEAVRFYVVDGFEATDLVKASKGPVRGAQYLQISPIIGAGVSASATAHEVGERLRGKSFL